MALGLANSITFVHRFADNGVDSICPRCFITVATTESEVELEAFEREHVCDPLLVNRFSRIQPLPLNNG